MVTRLALIVITAAVLTAGMAADSAAAALPKLPRKAAPGQSLKVPALKGGRVRYYLSHDAKRSLDDILLVSETKSRARSKRALASAAKPAATARVAIPPVPGGSYRLLSCAGTHCLASPGVLTVADGQPTQIQAFSDTHDTSDPYLASTYRFDPSICPPPAPPGQLPSTAGALSAAQALLANAAGGPGMAAFKSSGAYKSADAGESAAVEAIAVGKPGAALAALLRAHELAPDQPRYLVGAAAILTQLGHPKEALALINASDQLAPTGSAPFGINTQAIALNAKGEALLALGQFADAEYFLRAAIEIDPLLSEAKQNLAVVLMCRQKNDEATKYFRVGILRQGVLNPDGSISLPSAEDLLDITHGTTPTLPPIPLPESFEAAKKYDAAFNAMSNASAQRQHDRRTRSSQLLQADFAHPDSLFTQQRDLEIVNVALNPPQLSAAKDAVLKSMTDTHAAVLAIANAVRDKGLEWQSHASAACQGIYDGARAQACFDQHYQDECAGPAHDANNKIADLLAAEDQLDRQYIASDYSWATAVLANIANPNVQEHWSLVLDDSAESTWAMPFGALGYWIATARNMYCGKAPAVDPTASTDGPVTPHSEPCPASVKGVKLSWKFAADRAGGVPFDLAIDVNCEKVSVEASAAVEGWVGVFGQLDWSPRSGKMTIFGGPKLGAKIPGTSLGTSFKDGLYITFKGDKSVGDFGFRTSVGGSAGFGPLAIKGGDSMDFSFAPVFGLAK